MFKRSTAVLSTVLMIALIVSAVLWGAYKGWRDERVQVEQSVAGLQEMLSVRREVAYNVLSVANRHLPEDDESVTSLRQDTDALGRRSTLTERAALNAKVERDATLVLEKLASLESVKADDRDLMYVSALLPQALEQSAKLTEQAAYNQMAEDYNHRKQRSLSGRLAGLLGIADAEVFAQSEVTP